MRDELRRLFPKYGVRKGHGTGSDADLCVDEDEDDFDDQQFTGWRQACKDILYLLFYDEDSQPFLTPLTRENLGEDVYEDYCQNIARPITFRMIKSTLFRGKADGGPGPHYTCADEFLQDMRLVFENCM